MQFTPGQRWFSLAEPELGLGTVLRVEARSVQLVYPASGEIRHYAISSAPLQRAEFRTGDRISGSGRSFVVERVTATDGTLHYAGENQTLSEGELDDIQDLATADEHLIAGRVGSAERFDFRLQALNYRAQARRSPAWGLLSARVDLIPHQLRVAEVACDLRPPRVLLADEVGMGKTIEAGLILTRLLAAGRIARVLVLLPEPLVYQWFVELLRRFNLRFAIFDEERCMAIEQSADGRNPFDDDQLVITDMDFLCGSEKRAAQIHAARWDMVIVDEAHHLAWSIERASPGYSLVERLARQSAGLILLTATPEQLGRDGHFARLRLLDPARYPELERYRGEAEGYVELSRIVDKLQNAQALTDDEREQLKVRLSDDDASLAALAKLDDDVNASAPLLDALIDRHGTGRVMFRNRRAVVGGFPQRIADIHDLDAENLDEARRQRLLVEFLSDAQQPPSTLSLDYSNDARLDWLIRLIDASPDEKFLLICRSQTKVIALEEALRVRSGVKLARFHEAMSIVQRDRNAAFFAEKDGARLLLCAEIGSEGRNFQFAHHLILWDLPLDPDLLEQRIGRLDRIGQRHDIHVHVAAFPGSAQHTLMRWYDQGLDAFRSSPADGRELFKRFGLRLVELAAEHAHGADNTDARDFDAEIDSLIVETRSVHAELSQLVHRGRDRLLELANQRVAAAEELRHTLLASDADLAADDFVLRLFEQFGIDNDDNGKRTYILDPEYLSTEGFPGLQDGPQQITFDRGVALAREEFPLLRADHPMVVGALDILLESDQGKAAFIADEALPARSAMLECVFVLECVAPRALSVERFLPPLPLRMAVDTKLQTRTDTRPSVAALKRAPDRSIDYPRYRKFLTQLVPPMVKRCGELAQQAAEQHIAQALLAAEQQLQADHSRLLALRAVNPSIRDSEVSAVADELTALRSVLPHSRLRLDAVRFVCSLDFLALR